ncbi:molybdate ABC transporter substrate-binding protein [Oceanospirillum sediminis]|uniref:Molybdate ABC transporter substrate-binding protein n=1 Tax=Oceanospirillum sediminis TaxID=2760088 RepID=A0A839IM63_9GAMM|nr:molybdate ABC transporter substrate-binding protein [Oceanospirillum sediminis]MBB1486483.1 molybdate ABC transporter substrate-binding protein [Oceanospirillum sediminis]
MYFSSLTILSDRHIRNRSHRTNRQYRVSVALLLAVITLLFSLNIQAKELHVAVATNFLGTMQQLAQNYQKSTGHQLLISSGSTGALYAQISNGAPFDLFFAADNQRPEKLEQQGLILTGSRFTYAQGVLVLWSSEDNLVDAKGEVLRHGQYEYLSIANPDNAPYGFAARQVLEVKGVWQTLEQQQRLIRASNIGQTYSQVASGAAAMGFIALAQARLEKKGSRWIPDASSYSPIMQQAVVLKTSSDPQLAQHFVSWLQQPSARRIIKNAGYYMPDVY